MTIAIGKRSKRTHAFAMLATALALAAAMTPEAGTGRAETILRVEAIVVRPPAMPTISQRGQSLWIDNPGAVAISIDDEAPSASRLVRLVPGHAPIRRITLTF